MLKWVFFTLYFISYSAFFLRYTINMVYEMTQTGDFPVLKNLLSLQHET